VQTFLPYPDFEQSARVLDRKRLGNQRSEALVLVRGGWRRHPASRMWEGHFYQLAEYGITMCRVWLEQGYNDALLERFCEVQASFSDTGLPSWFGDPAFHVTHQSNLVRKLPSYYGPRFPGVPADLPYLWPRPVLR
jgi:hypothetical protein